MPPHCDTMDGPVVMAAKRALEAGNVDLVLPFVSTEGEAEVIRAFDKVMRVKSDGPAREIADLYFFETVVRIHRLGEGAPYTGLKPAGLSQGPVIPVAERAIETGSPDELTQILCDTVREEVKKRLDRAVRLKRHATASVADAREHVEAALGLQVWSHTLYQCAKAEPHAKGEAHEQHEVVHAHG